MLQPELISMLKKYRFLLEMSEEVFRDKVIRPLFLRLGYEGGMDTCGTEEEGKDCIFTQSHNLMGRIIYAVQTKKGNLNLSSEAAGNVVQAATQLKTALETKIHMLDLKQKVLPDFVFLCASGKINKRSRDYICESVDDKRIKFFDRDDLIPLIDNLYKELWLGIDADKMPYLKKLKEYLSNFNENNPVSDLVASDSKLTVVTNERYVPLKVSFVHQRVRKFKGKIYPDPRIEEIPAEALLRRNGNRFLLLGEAGTGKSTILKRLAYVLCEQYIEENKPISIPVLLRTVDIVEKEENLVDICYEAVQAISNRSCFSSDDLQQGNLVVLIDALDEEGNPDKIIKLLLKVDEFILSYPKCRVVITSRDYAYIKNLSELSKFEEFRLCSFSLSQARQVVEKLSRSRSLPADIINEILRKLQDVHGLDLNPLLVTVFVATSEYSRKDIPANITEIFKKFTEMMLGRWDSTKGLSLQYQAQLKDFLLQRLAFEMHQREVVSIGEDECKRIFTRELDRIGKKEEDTKQLIYEIVYRSGLFRCIESRLEFRHMLLQEFFAGRGIPSSDMIPTMTKDPWWMRAIIFYFGQNPHDSNALENITSGLHVLNQYEQFQAAITVGLSLQACYLMDIIKKQQLFKWVVLMLSRVEVTQLSDEKVGQVRPLMQFINYYLFGRASVASEILENDSSAISNDLIKDNMDIAEKIKFWIIAGLVESGYAEEAESALKDFHPEDKRFLLALHLGCFLMHKLKMFSKQQQNAAGRICKSLEQKVGDLRLKVFEEFKTELLEVRKDHIKAIEVK